MKLEKYGELTNKVRWKVLRIGFARITPSRCTRETSQVHTKICLEAIEFILRRPASNIGFFVRRSRKEPEHLDFGSIGIGGVNYKRGISDSQVCMVRNTMFSDNTEVYGKQFH